MTWKRRAGWLLATALTLANPLLHKPVSDMCDWARAVWGFTVYDRVALVGIPLLTLGTIAAVLALGRALRLRRELLVGALVVAALSVAAQRWLLVANIELIHFPQYALLAGILLVCGLRAPAAYLGSTAAGVLDEAYQHLVVYAGRSDTYFDINDIVLNALGAAWGVVLLSDLLSRRDKAESSVAGGVERRRTLTRGAAASLTALPLTLWLDPPHFVPMFRPLTTAHAMFRVLSTAEGLVLLSLLWIVIVFATDRRTNRRPLSVGVSRLPFIWLCLALIVCSSACASAPLRAAGAPRTPAPSASLRTSDPFITTFWCGPPLDLFDDARAEEIVEAGFTVVGPPCEGGGDTESKRRALDVAARHGLKLWIADGRFSEHARALPDWEAQIATAAAEYKDHVAFGGYFVTDEPAPQQFEDLAAIVTRLRQVDSHGQVYLNLLADYVGFEPGRYRDYVERFVATVHPSILSYDYYPFLVARDRPTFFSNLALVREIALEHDLPFMLILLAMPHGPYRDPTEPELSWQALHALAYGARGISYFAYWTPVNVEFQDVMKFRHGLIENGARTEHYFQAMRLNQVVQAVANQLSSFRSVGVGDSAGKVAASLRLGPIASIDGDAVTIGSFIDDTGRGAVLLVNRDYRRAAIVRLRLRPGERAPQRFDTQSSAWTDGNGSLMLPPGGSQLLRWSPQH